MPRVMEVAARQAPFAAFSGCADLRVSIEILFDQGFGDLFVTRIVHNAATNENIGSVELDILVLGPKVLYVLGYFSCGAVTATLKGVEAPGQISGFFRRLRSAVKPSRGDLTVAMQTGNDVGGSLGGAGNRPFWVRFFRASFS